MFVLLLLVVAVVPWSLPFGRSFVRGFAVQVGELEDEGGRKCRLGASLFAQG